MSPKSAKSVRLSSAKSDDQPATRKMLKLVRTELVQRMDAGFNRMEARFSGIDGKFSGIDGKFSGIEARFNDIDARFSGIDARFSRIEARFNDIDARFNDIDARFDNLEASHARMELLLEEQTANNRIVLEGLQALWQRQDRLEARLDSIPTP